MTNTHLEFRQMLVNSASVTSIVPADRIFQPWFPEKSAMPLVAFRENSNITDDQSYFDNIPRSEYFEIEVHIFDKPGKSVYELRAAIDSVAILNGYNRGYSEQIQDPEDYTHFVTIYSKRSALNIN